MVSTDYSCGLTLIDLLPLLAVAGVLHHKRICLHDRPGSSPVHIKHHQP